MTKSKSISRFAVLVLGALLVGLPATRALAAEPTSAPEAQAMAQHYREQAEHFRSLGGVGYKAGLVQRAEADAAKYSALAEQLQAPAAAVPARSPEAEHYAQLAEQYRKMGGTGYKTGLVQWAEAQQRKYEPVEVTAAPATPTPSPDCTAAAKPIVRMIACSR
jgi:hypothetical protein